MSKGLITGLPLFKRGKVRDIYGYRVRLLRLNNFKIENQGSSGTGTGLESCSST